MVEYPAAQLDRVFHALSDPTRRFMLHAMAESAQSIGELAAPHQMSFAAVSKHVKVLEVAGLLRREVRGREHVCHLTVAPLAAASDFLASYAAFWSARLDALEAVVAEEAEAEQARRREGAQPRRRIKPDRNTTSRAKRLTR
ncbi:MAG TPA: metalloregulator ArsR/SmtB family transcription factor [Polyangiales bacterium]|nr:metalloregulator ArsR/SmtB family transcription factor [Polyangiales bacterium]